MTNLLPQQRPADGSHPDPVVELDLFQVREHLLALRAQLEDGDPALDGPSDPASSEQAVVLAAQAANRQKLAQVLAALVSIEQGTYGTCVDCTRPIQPARLTARPFAIRCVTCQQGVDQRGSRGQGWNFPTSQWLAD
jgi:RNA polymerase-binding transcription factor DksA